jgi:hypothetical protein
MKPVLLLFLLGAGCATGFAQTLSFKFGTPFKRADLDVRWHAPSNSLPKEAMVYRLRPRQFSASTISNLMALGPFTQSDLVYSNANEMLFKKKSDELTSLLVSTRHGAIRLQKSNPYGPTNLATHIPPPSELPALTSSFLREVGIDIADVEKRPDGKPDFHYWEPSTEYFINHQFLTNTEFRAVSFRRCVDGASWVGNGSGGNCEINFGAYGKPSGIRLSWRPLESYKRYPTADPTAIIKWIRNGRAVQGVTRMDAEIINWKTVKSLTVTKADLCYYAGDPFNPSDWLIPFVALWTTVDTGHSTMDVEIDCPIVDKAQP